MSQGVVSDIIVLGVTRAISAERLEAYRPQGGTDSQMVEVYRWNLELSEALYPTLHALEISLRNNIHRAGVEIFGCDMWFGNVCHVPLRDNELRSLRNAQEKLRVKRKPITAGRIIAELNFGFWVALLNQPYSKLWQPPRSLLEKAFPKVDSKRFQHRKELHPRLDRIREFRNRVFHHEPIWNWPPQHIAKQYPKIIDLNLAVQYAEIVQTISWLSPEMAKIIRERDRFLEVYKRGNEIPGVSLSELPPWSHRYCVTRP